MYQDNILTKHILRKFTENFLPWNIHENILWLFLFYDVNFYQYFFLYDAIFHNLSKLKNFSRLQLQTSKAR